MQGLRGDGAAAEMGFFRAVRACPWSKAIYTDFLAIRPDKLTMVLDLMVRIALFLILEVGR